MLPSGFSPLMTDLSRLLDHFRASSGACTDTRRLEKGCMFFALKGPSFDANAFATQALEGGAAYAVVDDPAVVRDERFLLVPDTLKALQDLARAYRRGFSIPVLGITGTNGKTTTKELLHAVLSSDRSVLSTSGNLNNHIGVPLTLLGLKPSHKLAVIEMGANKPGDIAELTAIAEPTHGLITNVGKAHLEGFGDFRGVLRTKLELYDHVRAQGSIVLVNADDALLMARSEGIARSTYGMSSSSDVHGMSVAEGPFLSFIFHAGSESSSVVRTRLIGDYNLPNALAAVCAGVHFGVPVDRIAEALAAYVPGNNRSQFTDTGRNHVVMDAYNANPSSLRAALVNFAGIAGERPKLVIAGDMLELGSVTAEEHQGIVDLIEQLELNAILVGSAFASTKDHQGLRRYADVTEASAALRNERPEGYLVLIKGSRGIKLETLMPAL
jgi:UDP-N-acetylmuramoyl-tripeptide--D-alanyl-D-alanine ligase